MNALMAIGIRYSLSVFWVIVISLSASAHADETRPQPRDAPWEIEPTEETKRRVAEEACRWPECPQLVISARLGEPLIFKLKRSPLSIQIRDPGTAVVTRKGREKTTLHGLVVGITTMTITYPTAVAGDEDDMIRYLIRVHID